MPVTTATEERPAAPPARRGRAALAGLLAAGAGTAVLAHLSAGPGGILERRYALLLLVGAWTALWVVAVACALRAPRRAAVVAVLLLAVVVRLASVAEKAPLSDDLYRYAWDGVVQHAGVNPYAYAPRDDALRPLRDTGGQDWLWPERLVGEERDALLNRTNVETIYPPVAEAWFYAVHAVVPLSLEDQGYELVGLAVDLAVLAVLLALLRQRGRDPREVAFYALCPLPVLEAVQNAHVDGLAVLLALLGVLAWPRRPAWAAAALTAAALVKVYPGALLPLLLRARTARARVLAVAVALPVVAYLPHVLDVGLKVLGYLPGYLGEEQYDQGTRYLLVGLTGLSGAPATAVTAVLLLGVLGWVLRSDVDLATASVRLLTGVFLLVTPVQPWYALLLLALATATGAWWAAAVALASYPLFFATIVEGSGATAGRLSYGAAAVVVLVVAVRARRAAAQRPVEVLAG